MDVFSLPETAGIYAIVNRTNGHRYVGQATNIRARVAQHLNDLRRGKEATNQTRLLQRAWDTFGEAAFFAEVLALVRNNKHEVPYRERPDNLSLAEHYYINERAEYNADRAIVRKSFARLVTGKEWLQHAPEIVPEASIVRPNSQGELRRYSYLVAERVSQRHPVIVLAADEREAKQRAAGLDAVIRSFGSNVSCWRLSASATRERIAAGTPDYRGGHSFFVS